MSKKFLHIVTAYLFHIILIVMSYVMMRSYYDTLQIIFLVLGILYLIYWIVCNRKSYMPWSVYFHFGVGALIQILLNECGIIPEDGGWFSGLGQFFYVIFVIVHAVVIGLTNLVLYGIAKRKKR